MIVVPKEILWKNLEEKGVQVAYIQAIRYIYDGVKLHQELMKGVD